MTVNYIQMNRACPKRENGNGNRKRKSKRPYMTHCNPSPLVCLHSKKNNTETMEKGKRETERERARER